MISDFYAFIDRLKAENFHISTEIINTSSEIKTSFIVTVNTTHLNSSLMDFNLFKNPNLSIFIESKEPRDFITYKEIIETELQRKQEFNVLFSYSQPFDLVNYETKKLNINLYNFEIYKSFIELVALKFKLKDLISLKYKINISCSELTGLKDTELITFNNPNQLITRETLAYIKSLHNREASIFTVPNSTPNNVGNKIYYIIIPNLLSQLATNYNNTHYRFIGKRLIIFNTDNIDQLDDPLNFFRILERTIKFVYSDTKTTDQKLTFYRKTLIDGHLKDQTFQIWQLDSTFFEKLFIDSENVFDAFQDESVSTFLKEKKEIIKEYMNISKEVINSIDNLKNTLLRNLITMLALIISNIALKSKGISDNTDYLVITGVASLFILVLIIIHYSNDVPLHSTIQKRIEIFDEHFKFISSSSLDLKKSIKSSVKSEVDKFKILLNIVGILYIIIFIIFLISFFSFLI